MRIKRAHLDALVFQLNQVLRRPTKMFASLAGEPTKFTVGHISLDKNSGGYQLEQTTSEDGGILIIRWRAKPKEMCIYIEGMCRGAAAEKG